MAGYRYCLLLFFVFQGIYSASAQLNSVLFRSQGELPVELLSDETEKFKSYKERKQSKEDAYYWSLVITLQNMIENHLIIYGNESQQYLQGLVDNICKVNGIHKKILVFQMNNTVINAFSIEPGYIFISTGMIANMVNEDNLFMVLCHEVAHITGEHSQKFYDVKKQIAKKEDLENIKPSEEFIKKILKYSRRQEREADSVGIRYYLRTGRASKGAVEMYHLLNSDSMNSTPSVYQFFQTLDLNPDSLKYYQVSTYKKLASDTVEDPELWSSHPSPKNRIQFILTQIHEKQDISLPVKTETFSKIHRQCLLNYALLCKIQGEYLNVINANQLYEAQYGLDTGMHTILASALANEMLYYISSSIHKKRMLPDYYPQPGTAAVIQRMNASDSTLAHRIMGLYFFKKMQTGQWKGDMDIYASAITLALRKSSQHQTHSTFTIIDNYLNATLKDSTYNPGAGKIENSGLLDPAEDQNQTKRKILSDQSKRLFIANKSDNITDTFSTVNYFSVHYLYSGNNTKKLKQKQKLIRYTQKEINRINEITHYQINDSFINRANMTAARLNQSYIYLLLNAERYNTVYSEFPLLMFSQVEQMETLKNHIVMRVLVLDDIYRIYRLAARKSTLVLISVQKVNQPEPLYLFVRINKGKLLPGVLGNYIYSAMVEAQAK